MNVNEVSELCKVLSDPHRIHILQMLVSGEKCASELLEQFTISQPTLSHHMKILCDAGIVTGRKEGRWTHYSISQENAAQIRACVQMLTAPGGGIRWDCRP